MAAGEQDMEILDSPLERKDSDSIWDEESVSPKSVDSDWSFSPSGSPVDTEDDRSISAIDKALEKQQVTLPSKKTSLLDGLLFEIYDRYHTNRESVDSDNITECSTTSGSLFGGSFDLEDRGERLTRVTLQSKDNEELRSLVEELSSQVNLLSAKLVRQLKRRDKNAYRLQRNFDILTAILQAVSLKRKVDTRIRFSYIPHKGKKAFRQWLDAFKAIARQPDGVPNEWRKRLWLCLADNKLANTDWKRTVKFCFNDRSNPDDENLGSQIVKDLHRTGCTWFCGAQDRPEDRAVLKRVLLAYARWNKAIGYCQGFNVIAALILQVTEGVEEDALKMMIYIIDYVLPNNYFSNNLRALSVDMAVLRDLMKIKLPELSKQLDDLQAQAAAANNGISSYEPPLINVFTMQWFLTMFATSLPEKVVLRIWDGLLMDGSETLLRVALALWEKLGEHLEDVETADEFYTSMGWLMEELRCGHLIDDDELMQTVYSLGTSPFTKLTELREKYTYNINPFSNMAPVNKNAKATCSSDEEEYDSDTEGVGCLGMFLASNDSAYNAIKNSPENEMGATDIAAASPGVFATDGYSPLSTSGGHRLGGREQKELSILQKQYDRMRQMQQQARVVFSDATVKTLKDSDKSRSIPTAINHLFVSASAQRKSNKLKSANNEHNEPDEKTSLMKNFFQTIREEAAAEAASLEKKSNVHTMESDAHLMELFKGKPIKVESPLTTEHKPITGKLEHVALNGTISCIKVGTQDEPTDSKPPSEKSNGVSENGSVSMTPAKYTVVSVKEIKEAHDSDTVPANNANQSTSCQSSPENLPATVIPDKSATYPARFQPFPHRHKPQRNALIYGKVRSEEGSKRAEAYKKQKGNNVRKNLVSQFRNLAMADSPSVNYFSPY